MVDKWRLRHYNFHCDIMLYDLNRNSGESFLILDFDHITDELIVYTEIERTRDGLFDTSNNITYRIGYDKENGEYKINEKELDFIMKLILSNYKKALNEYRKDMVKEIFR